MVGAIKEFLDSFVAGTNMETAQFYAVKLTGPNTVSVTTALTDRAIGLLQNRPRQGEAAAVCHTGRSFARADGGTTAIAVGDFVGPSANGRLVKKAVADNSTIGIALTACAANDMVIEVGLGYPTGVYAVPA